jgi:hypothetical protein
MTHDRDVERLLGQWLGEGPTEVPDRVIDVIADRIGRQPQRPAWRFHWRPSAMTPKLGAAAALAAVVIVALGAIYLLRPSAGPSVGGLNPTTSPSPVASPSAASQSPSASPNAISSVIFKPALSLVAPAGWTAGDGDRTFILDAPAEPSGAHDSVSVMSGPFVRFNDRDCENRAPAGVGTSVAKVIAALTGDPRLVATSAQPVTVGDRAGQMLDIQVAPSWTGTCGWSGGKPAVLILSATDTGPAFGIGGTERARYMFLDVGGSVVAINFSTPDGTGFDALVAQATPIVASMRFTP